MKKVHENLNLVLKRQNMTLKKFEANIRVCVFQKQCVLKNLKFREKRDQSALAYLRKTL